MPFTCSRMLRYLSRVNGAFLFLDLRFTCPETGQAPLQLTGTVQLRTLTCPIYFYIVISIYIFKTAINMLQ